MFKHKNYQILFLIDKTFPLGDLIFFSKNLKGLKTPKI